jgi:hypothetical protein
MHTFRSSGAPAISQPLPLFPISSPLTHVGVSSSSTPLIARGIGASISPQNHLLISRHVVFDESFPFASPASSQPSHLDDLDFLFESDLVVLLIGPPLPPPVTSTSKHVAACIDIPARIAHSLEITARVTCGTGPGTTSTLRPAASGLHAESPGSFTYALTPTWCDGSTSPSTA